METAGVDDSIGERASRLVAHSSQADPPLRRRLMASNTLVLKSTIFPEWFQERVQPWVQYVASFIRPLDLLADKLSWSLVQLRARQHRLPRSVGYHGVLHW